MLSKDIIDLHEYLEVYRQSPLRLVLEAITDGHSSLIELVAQLSETSDPSALQKTARSLATLLNEMGAQVRQQPSAQVFRNLDGLKGSGLTRFARVDLDYFETQYDSFLRQQSTRNMTELVFAGLKLNAVLNELSALGSELKKSAADLPGSHLTIELGTIIELEDFARKLGAIASIYEQVATIINISPAEQPLQIVKVETGSAWIDLVGNEEIIAVTAFIIIGAFRYIYRNLTPEGKIRSLPQRFRDLDEALQITKKLESQGLDMNLAKDQLEAIP